jgi:hypothetical protein
MRKYLYLFLAFGLSILFISKANALTYTINGAASSSTQLSGSSSGNKQSFDVDLNLSSMPQSLVIDSAVLQFTTSGNSSVGDIRLLDKFKTSSTNLIDLISLDNAGTKQTINIFSNVKEWYANSLYNFGISFASKDFAATDNIIISNITLYVEASEKDTVAPLLNRQEIVKSDGEVYKFLIETNEASKVIINLGKTSGYDQKASSEISFLTAHELTFSNLQNGVTYHYQIIATDSSGNKLTTTDNTFLTSVVFQTQTGSYVQDSTLYPPNNLGQELAKKSGKYSVLLSWTPTISEGTDGYIVFRKSSDSNNYVELTKLSSATMSYQDESVESGIIYDYVINTYKSDKISYDGAKVQVEIPSANTDGSNTTPQTTYNTGQVLLILFAIAVIIYIVGYLIVKYIPRYLIKKPNKQPLRNVLNDPSYFEDTVTSEFGTKTETDYPLEDPIPGRDMN